MLTREEQTDLLDLTWHWDTAYRFEVIDSVWRAIPADEPASVLAADTAAELREKVRDDYAARQSAARASGYLQERMST